MDRIKFKNISDDGAMANGTSLQGYLRDITTRQLTEMFGEPNMVPSGDGKVTSEWIIKTEITDEDGDIESGLFTLYDWKGSRPYDDNEVWTINVGGKSKQDFWNALDAQDIAEKTDFLYAYDCDGKLLQEDFSLQLLGLCRGYYISRKEVANG